MFVDLAGETGSVQIGYELAFILKTMKKSTKLLAVVVTIAAALLFAIDFSGYRTLGSDHSDTPNLIAVPRHDARITDLYAFQDGDDLVLALCVDPTIPAGVSEYIFQPDVIYDINIDNSSAVNHNDPDANETLGGTVTRPEKIKSNIVFRVTFNDGTPRLRVRGIKKGADSAQVFAGLRDDPFIRGPRIGRNVAAIVIKIPMSKVLGDQPELLIWAYSRVPEIDKPEADHGGMALRSQFPENMPMNEMEPRHHKRRMGLEPDVIIYNTSFSAIFPNGRQLTDDVVDLVEDPRVLSNDFPFPAVNDVPFLSEFPYLAPPQLP